MSSSLPEDNRTRLLQVAAELFACKGYHATGMKDLERASGLGRSSLYYYFSNKEELLFEITTRYLCELVEIGEQLLEESIDPVIRLRQFSRAVMYSVAHDLSELTVCFRELHSVTGDNKQALLSLHRSYEQIWGRILTSGVTTGVFASADAMTVKAAIGMHHYSYLWLRPDGKRSPESIADTFCDLLINGLAGPNPSSVAGELESP